MSQLERDPNTSDIYTMPLTQVSIEHDTAGLFDRFQHALIKLDLQDNDLIQNSLFLGLTLHQNDERSYEPYNNHLLRVALRVIEELRVEDPVTIAAALLHDSLEDHPEALSKFYLDIEAPEDPYVARFLGYTALKMFAAEYDDAHELADIVLAVSNPLLDPGEDKTTSYVEHIRNLMQNGPLKARVVKIGDIADNFDVPDGLEDPGKRERLDEKQKHVIPLVEGGLDRSEEMVPEQARDNVLRVFADRQEAAARRLKKVAERKTA